jgi:hypothetical protein
MAEHEQCLEYYGFLGRSVAETGVEIEEPI